jgi:hypothetical protein
MIPRLEVSKEHFPQRRKGAKKNSIAFFAPLRLCGRLSLSFENRYKSHEN